MISNNILSSGFRFLKSNKIKIIITGLAVVLSSGFWMSELHGKLEKLSGKVEEVNNETIDDLFVLLGYDQISHKLRINHPDDVDLGHQRGMTGSIEHCAQQINRIIDNDVGGSTSIALPSSIKSPLGSIYVISLHSTFTKDIIEKISNIFAIDDVYQVSLLLSYLFALALGEYTETLQDGDCVIRWSTRSGHNAVDYRGNIAGVLTHLNHNTIQDDEFRCRVKQLQNRYSARSANDIIKGLSQEFDFGLSLSYHKK